MRVTRVCILSWLCLVLAQPLFALGGPGGDEAVLGDRAAAEAAWPAIRAGALVLDVRSPEEFAAGHLEGAVNIPHTELDRITAAIGDDRDRPVILYCRSGGRAGRVLESLETLGYRNALNATGLEALEATRPTLPESE